MSASRTQFAIRQELSSSLNERLARRYRDEWIDSQHDLNVVVGLVAKKDPSLRHVKVIQTFHGTLDIGRFLDALAGSEVRTVAFVGINMDDDYCAKLATAISDFNSSMSCLQLCRIVPTGVAKICPALSNSHSLKELRLTFNHDLSQERVAMLMKSVGESKTLEIFKLYCVDLQSEGTEHLAAAVKSAEGLTDLRITSCNLNDIKCLANAIKEANRLKRVDFSMNRISDSGPVTTLWECQSITYLSLSQNELGADTNTEENKADMEGRFTALAKNTTLTKMYLDMNPLCSEYVVFLTKALEQNTTLMRLGLLTLTVPSMAARRIRYLVSLNCAGRGGIRKDCPDRRLFPHLLSRVSKDPEMIYGLLTQTPHVWMETKKRRRDGDSRK